MFELSLTLGAAALLYPDLRKELREIRQIRDNGALNDVRYEKQR